VNLTEQPFFVLHLDDIEIAYFERVQFSLRNFDVVFVLKDYDKPVIHINSVPVEHLETIKEWLNSCDIKYYEGTQTLNWNRIMATIKEDPVRFHAEEGGWNFLSTESSDEEEEGSDDEEGSGGEKKEKKPRRGSDEDDDDSSEFEPQSSAEGEEEEEEEAAEADDSDAFSEVSEDSEDYEDEEESDGEDWDDLEEKARRDDRDRATKLKDKGRRDEYSGSEEDDDRPKKKSKK